MKKSHIANNVGLFWFEILTTKKLVASLKIWKNLIKNLTDLTLQSF